MARFTPGELKVMRLLWEHGELKPGELQQRFPELIKNPALRTAIPLDSNGNARGSLKVKPAGGAAQIELPRDALYIVLKADGP